MAAGKSYEERKAAWAEKMRARGVRALDRPAGDRLPPGQRRVEDFPVLDLGIHPEVDEDEWRLEVVGRVEQELALTWAEWQRLPRVDSVSDFHCVTTWSRFDLRWGGVRFRELLDRVRPTAEAAFAFFTCYDGYTTGLALDELLGDDVLLADRLDGDPLPLRHGGRLRVVVPHLYAWKAAKFIRRIELTDREMPGYWERRGYSQTADPWTEDRFSRTDPDA